MKPEDKWPNPLELAEYESVFPDDINYYEPEDFIYRLGAWLRDDRIRTRKEQVRANQESRSANTLQGAGVFAY